MTLAVVGAGVVGRLMALRLRRRGWSVTLYEQGDWDAPTACSHAAAGMLAPIAEAVKGEAELVPLGLRSLGLWPDLLASLPRPVPFHQAGTLVAARRADWGELAEYHDRIRQKAPFARLLSLTGDELARHEKDLQHSDLSSLLLQDEGQIDNLTLLKVLGEALTSEGVSLRPRTPVTTLAPRLVSTASETIPYDLVVDCRGLGAQTDLPRLRGVRGEALIVRAPEVRLGRPVRLLHPRYPVYVVPRGQENYVVGATMIESESREPISVASTLELLTGALLLHPGFRQAQVVGLVANARPAFDDNWPRILAEPGLIRVNGLFRHGFLLSPLVTEVAVNLIDGQPLESELRPLVAERRVERLSKDPPPKELQWN